VALVHLVAMAERGGVPVVSIGDHQLLLAEACLELGVRLGRPQAVPDTLVVHQLGDRGGGGGVVEQPGERSARTAEHRLDAREVRADLADQPEAVVDRPRHRPLVGEDRPTPRLDLDGAHQPTNAPVDAVDLEAQLVGVVERACGPDQRPAVDPAADPRARPPILVVLLVVARCVLAELQTDHVVGAGIEVPPLIGWQDRVVRRCGHALQRPDPRDIEEQPDER
jgi:hypothetical protein